MIDSSDKKYNLQKTGTLLIFRTEYFQAERGSYLHSGIYNREFVSLLASTAVAGVIYIIIMMNLRESPVYFILVAFILIAGFPFFRKFVFSGRYIEIVLNHATGLAEIYISGIVRRKKGTVSLSNIKDITIQFKHLPVENPDGAAFVERISLQHGMVIPGFAEEIKLSVLKLAFADGTEKTIYADSNKQDVVSLQNEIREFLKI